MILLKKSLILLSAASIFVSTTACSGDNRNTPQELKASEGEIRKNIEEPTELTVFSLESPDGWNQKYGEYLKKKLPQYKITHISQTESTRLEHLLSAGTNIDLYIANARSVKQQYLPSKTAFDMSNLAKTHQIDLSAFEPEGINQMTSAEGAGGLYGLPLSNYSMVMYYNKDIFDKIGVPYPVDGMTWDETYELAKKLTVNTGEKQYLGFWISPKHYLRTNQMSLALVDPKTEKASVSSDEWIRLFDTIFKKFSDITAFRERAITAWPSHDAFNVTQELAMYVMQSSWLMAAQESLNKMNFDMVAMPTFKDKPNVGVQASYTYMGITSMSQKKDQAMEVIRQLTSEEYQKEMSSLGVMTSLKSQAVQKAYATNTPYKNKKLNMNAAFYNKFAPTAPITPYDEFVVEDGLEKTQLRDIVKGLIDLNTGLRKAEEIANQKISTSK
ncbi:ABC transporter substrate-binding protein [Paenibacillus sp. UNC451MF]|uniref:ABC transporter substrate-binding protein n=1 Tax=Paenibacillus sp. UNC451MF TaxID=1449063 RepID=UPI00048FA70B|nr:extracellular solute-binding protein [Paenibacillus sp. UNC451MF]